MKIRLTTDWLDYYDHCFEDRNSKEYDLHWFRMSAEGHGPNRAEAFRIMKGMDLEVIPHGTFSDMKDLYPKDKLVIYDRGWAHAGNGKILYPDEKTNNLTVGPNKLCSLFIATGKPTVSYKYLYIGNKQIHMMLQSDTHWMTNVETTNVEILEIKDCKQNHRPIWAYDYVMDKGIKYAIDLNHAPGMRSTGLKDHLEPRDIHKLITNWFEVQSNLNSDYI